MTSVATRTPLQGAGIAASVVLCCYTMDRWPQIVAACGSLRVQQHPPAEVILVVDHNPDLLDRAGRELRGVTVIPNSGPRGLSGARNTGVAASRGDVVAFLDDDAVASTDWLRRLVDEYEDPRVIGAGGHVEPDWELSRPAWFPPEFDWVVGCSHSGMPGQAARVRNLIGANMSFRRDVLVEVGGFRPDLGRVGVLPTGCEETELCIRASSGRPEGIFRYQPEAQVHHRVPRQRGTWRYFRERCYSEGLSKAAVSGLTGRRSALASERAYVRRVLPQGLVRAAAGLDLGRGAAMVMGLTATTAGYVAGVGLRRRPSAANAVGLVRAHAVEVVPLILALALWVASMGSVDLPAMTDLGLVSVLPPAYWMALALVVVSLAVLIHTRRGSPGLRVAYLAVLIVVLHGTPAVLYGSLRYGWAWKHVGIVDYIVHHGGVDPAIGGSFAAYHSWPGFFAINATVVNASGLSSSLAYASWAPLAFELAAMGPLIALFNTLSRDRRQAWLAVLVFYLANWIGQDYFSPQAFAYLLYLVVLMVCLRWLPAAKDPASLGRWRRWLAPDVPRAERAPLPRHFLSAVVVLLMVTIASSHQLTPFMLLSTLTLLVVGRHTGPAWLPWLLGAFTLAWIVLMARPFLSDNLYWILQSIGRPGQNTQSTFIDLSHASADQRLVAYAGRGLTAAVGVLAFVGFWRLRRAGQPHRSAALLATSPALLLAANSYGGEMLFRVYLFALPFLALLAAGTVYAGSDAPRQAPGPVGGVLRRSLAMVPTLLLVIGLVVPFTLAYYGKERANYFSPDEVAASAWLYDHAPPGSRVVAANPALPWAYTHYETFDYVFLEDLPSSERANLARDPMQVLGQAVGSWAGPVYVILGASQSNEAHYTGLMPQGAAEAMSVALLQSPSARVVFATRDATVFQLDTPFDGGHP